VAPRAATLTVSLSHGTTVRSAQTPGRDGAGSVVRHSGAAKEITGLGRSPFHQSRAIKRTRREETYEPPQTPAVPPITLYLGRV
jgi:hypothetical protein